MNTTQRPAGQRNAYSDEVKNKALQYLNNGYSSQQISVELGVSTTALLDWRRKATQTNLPKKARFDADFKARALQKLDGGQSLQQVSKVMGVSTQSLRQWRQKRQGPVQSAAPRFASHEANRGMSYQDGFPEMIQDINENGQPLQLITNTSGLAGPSSHRWISPSPVQELATTGLNDPQRRNTDEAQQQALGLLNAGQSITQVSIYLGISPAQVRRWWLHRQAAERSEPLGDGRRLYDNSFKMEALWQIEQGGSVRQVARSLGVTEVTLHKWRKQVASGHAFMIEPSLSGSILSTEPKTHEPAVDRIARLEQQLRHVEQERDTLKKAIQILTRTN